MRSLKNLRRVSWRGIKKIKSYSRNISKRKNAHAEAMRVFRDRTWEGLQCYVGSHLMSGSLALGLHRYFFNRLIVQKAVVVDNQRRGVILPYDVMVEVNFFLLSLHST